MIFLSIEWEVLRTGSCIISSECSVLGEIDVLLNNYSNVFVTVWIAGSPNENEGKSLLFEREDSIGLRIGVSKGIILGDAYD